MKILVYDIGCPGSGILYPIKEAFETIGHQVNMFDWRRYLYAYAKPGIVERIKDRALFYVVAKRINKALIEDIEEYHYDLMLVVRGDHVYPDTIIKAKKCIPIVVN